MKATAAANPQNDANPQAQATAKSMNLMLPVTSLWLGYSMPAAMAIYWIANNVFTTIRDLILIRIVKKQIAAEDAVREASRSERERELEEKRLETERLRAEGKTEQNANTSKKKLQAGEKQKSEERKAALERAERAARRERLGVPETEKPASQVGNRRYARGRAYVEDRFDNPEQAEEATLLAAEASENAPAIDETVEAVEIDELVETVETEGEV
jgi:YidC/Oxa1 family membrane protein insertase